MGSVTKKYPFWKKKNNADIGNFHIFSEHLPSSPT